MRGLPTSSVWHGLPPWPHQLGAYETCVELLRSPTKRRRRGLVQMPTGTGKSRLMRALTYWLISQGRRVLVCLPTEEILDQLRCDFRRETRTPFAVEKAEQVASLSPRIVLASQQTIWRRLKRHPEDTVVLYDEAHHTNAQAGKNLSTLDRFGEVLGFTASPWSPECEEVYKGQVLYEYPLSAAINEGYLCPYELWPFPDLLPRPGRHELYYCESNEEARELARAVPGSAYLGFDTPNRDQVVTRFREGQVRRLYLNRMLCEGFNCPEVASIFIDKTPQSDILQYQMVGRGLRKKPDGAGLAVYCRDIDAVQAALDRAG